jgi:hypothetical protein
VEKIEHSSEAARVRCAHECANLPIGGDDARCRLSPKEDATCSQSFA